MESYQLLGYCMLIFMLLQLLSTVIYYICIVASIIFLLSGILIYIFKISLYQLHVNQMKLFINEVQYRVPIGGSEIICGKWYVGVSYSLFPENELTKVLWVLCTPECYRSKTKVFSWFAKKS